MLHLSQTRKNIQPKRPQQHHTNTRAKVVEFSGVSKAFGDRLLVEGLTFSVPPGAVVGIIGGNGAGKSTTFKMIMGQEAPDSGTIELGDTVVPMYVDQARDALDANKTVRCSWRVCVCSSGSGGAQRGLPLLWWCCDAVISALSR